MERKIKPIYNIGRTFCIEYLLWNKNSQTFSVCRQFQAKFLVGLQIFLVFVSACNTIYNYHHQSNLLLDMMQYSLIFCALLLVTILNIFYYATQEDQICIYKSIDEVDILLDSHGGDTSKLFPDPRIKLLTNVLFLMGSITVVTLFGLHIVEKEKHITMQLLPGILACYRGSVALFILLVIKDRYMALNNILKNLVERKDDPSCVACTHMYLKITPKLDSGKMCCKHTLLFAIIVYEKLERICEAWRKLYSFFLSMSMLYLLLISPVSIVYWVRLIWFNESWKNLTKLYIYVVVCFIGLNLATCFNFFCDATSFEAQKVPRWFHRSYLYCIERTTIKSAVFNLSVKTMNSPLQFPILDMYLCSRKTFLTVFSSVLIVTSYLWTSDRNQP